MKKIPALHPFVPQFESVPFKILLLFFVCAMHVAAHGQTATNKAMLFVENRDKFPSDTDFVAARIQTPWGRTSVKNTNQDTAHIRLHNNGVDPLIISKLTLSDSVNWKLSKLNSVAFNAATLPVTINSGSFVDLSVAFVAIDSTPRVKLLVSDLSILSNDGTSPTKKLHLHGLWQKRGEGNNEPRAQEIINTFGFATKTGFTATDPDKGANDKPKGNEVLSSYFVRADTTRPVSIRQMAAYHGCCEVQSETLRWYKKGDTTKLNAIVFHLAEDAQRLLPTSSRSDGSFAEGSFSSSGSFGFRVGSDDWSDTMLNPDRVIGLRVWTAINAQGRIIPNAYILSNDYLGTEATNSDYNDNMYYVTNIRPELGPASASSLTTTPSAVEFAEQVLQSANHFTLTLRSLGQTYQSGAKDPDIKISSLAITGSNASEFVALPPADSILHPGGTTTLRIDFTPQSEGLKTADLLIYCNNAASPYRVPLYGIAKGPNTSVLIPYRLKSGASSDVTINGKTWLADTSYAFDKFVSYSNPQVAQIRATDEDSLYLQQLSSKADGQTFRYELPLANGDYWLRLHFAEIFWNAPGGDLRGGAGSRVMNIGIENELKLINLDMAGEVGTASALVRTIPVTVQDGKLSINFSATVNRPSLSALEVYQFKIGTVTSVDNPSSDRTQNPVVYPNPLHQQFNIAFPASYKGKTTLQLVDVAGKTYELGNIFLSGNGSTIPVDISAHKLSSGVYFLRIATAGGRKTTLTIFRW